MDRPRQVELGLTVAGLLTLLVGAYVPSIRPGPGEPPDVMLPEFLLPGLDAGFGLLDLPVIAFGLVLLAYHRPGVAARERARLAAWTGMVALAVGVFGVLGNPMVGFDGTYVPATGWYLTMAGGAVLLASAVVSIASALKAYLELVLEYVSGSW